MTKFIRPVLIDFIIQFIFSCNSQLKVKPQADVKMISKHIKIDDKVIETRDPSAVIDPLWWSVSIYDTKEKYEKDLVPFSVQQRAVFALMWYIAEVDNGGHSQFYSNSTGIVWADAMRGFEMLGIPEAKNIIEESASLFRPKPSFDREERNKSMELLDPDFEDLDSRFYKLDSTINITGRIADYILRNKKAFYFEGDVKVPG